MWEDVAREQREDCLGRRVETVCAGDTVSCIFHSLTSLIAVPHQFLPCWHRMDTVVHRGALGPASCIHAKGHGISSNLNAMRVCWCVVPGPRYPGRKPAGVCASFFFGALDGAIAVHACGQSVYIIVSSLL